VAASASIPAAPIRASAASYSTDTYGAISPRKPSVVVTSPQKEASSLRPDAEAEVLSPTDASLPLPDTEAGPLGQTDASILLPDAEAGTLSRADATSDKDFLRPEVGATATSHILSACTVSSDQDLFTSFKYPDNQDSFDKQTTRIPRKTVRIVSNFKRRDNDSNSSGSNGPNDGSNSANDDSNAANGDKDTDSDSVSRFSYSNNNGSSHDSHGDSSNGGSGASVINDRATGNSRSGVTIIVEDAASLGHDGPPAPMIVARGGKKWRKTLFGLAALKEMPLSRKSMVSFNL